ncbi:magnesium-translocating P-type ATPase, partial [Cryobacterium lactosi]
RPTHPRARSAPATTFWAMSADEVAALFPALEATDRPLSQARGRSRLRAWVGITLRQLSSPITMILLVAALIATATGDTVDGGVILLIVVLSAALGAWQEGRAADAVASLLASVAVTVRVQQGDTVVDLPTDAVRPGDRIVLDAGDLVPADCRLVETDDLQVDESSLTGESFPVPKVAGEPLPADTPLAQRSNTLFNGTSVVSGKAVAIAVLVGADSTFGHISTALEKRAKPTSFETGIRQFGLLLLRVMVVMVVAILVITLVLGRPLIDSLLFALALAVGITPQMLPVVVSVSLAAGARRMARRDVIVKRLDVIEDLGAMSVLCTDKTGTITAGSVRVDRATDAAGRPSERVLDLAALNAGLQTGYANPLDLAVLARRTPPTGAVLLDEVPYDFTRKRLSVVATVDGQRTMITKGAFEGLLACCSQVEVDGAVLSIEPRRAEITERFRRFSAEGFRVIGLAAAPISSERPLTVADEQGLIFIGFLALLDPVKTDARASLAELARLGIRTKILTGDNRYVAAALAPQLGIEAGRVAVGADLTGLGRAQVHELVSRTSIFAEVEPSQKQVIVTALRDAGETVGFLGDGINDATALHGADGGISVDTAASVAKKAAAVVLLTKELAVVATGVRLGRHTFANTLKYVRVASSANFGNILSMVVAAATLPFLPMLPGQILLLNFLADIPNTLVSRDNVDPERVERAGVWDMRRVTRFMIAFGLLSTVFDLATFALMRWVFHTDAATFRTGWFIESGLTQFVAMMTLRTSRPAWRSRPDTVFFWVSLGVAAATVTLTFTPLGALAAFVAVPPALLLALFAMVVGYGLSNEVLKRFVRF